MLRDAHPLRWLLMTPLIDPIERQQARLLQVFLLALIGATVISDPIFLLLADHATGVAILITQIAAVACSLAALAAIHTGGLQRAIGITAIGLLGAMTILLVAVGLPIGNAFLITFAFPLCVVGLLGSRLMLCRVTISSILIVALTPLLHSWARLTAVDAVGDYVALYAIITFGAVTSAVAIFLDRAGMVLRTALQASLQREQELQRTRQILEHEIQHRQNLQTQLAHAQKMESIGRLAGGIAHDFNNLLAIILTCTQLAQHDLPPEIEIQGDLDEIEHAARRAAGLTRQLLAFAQQQPLIWERIALNPLIRDIQPLIQRMLNATITLHVTLETNLGMIQGDVGQVEQILLNLAANARDAMPQGGTLTITTGHMVMDYATAERRGNLQPGPYVLVSIQDTGVGMDQATQDKIFEPFFTTKEPGQGTGLGLSITYGIVQAHGGTIACVSAVNGGTTFTIYFPQSEQEHEEEATEARTIATARNRRTTL